MYILFYILIFSLIFRLFISLIYSFPTLALLLLVAYIGYTYYIKRHKRVQGWNRSAYQRNTYTQNKQPFTNTSSNPNPKDVFDAEYTEQEVH